MADQKFADYAPVLNGLGVTLSDCTDVQLKEPPTSGGTKGLTKDLALEIIPKLNDVEGNGGYTQIAMDSGVSPSDVQKIHSEFLLAHNPPQVVEEVLPE